MFNVKKIEYVNKTFRMPADLVKTLEVLAQEQKISLNNLVVQCCEYALSNLEPSQMLDVDVTDVGDGQPAE